MTFGSRSLLRKLDALNALSISGCHKIYRVDQYPYLGVMLDPELNLSLVANETIQKVNHKLYLMSVIRKVLPTFGAVLLDKTMVLAYFNYCNYLLNSCTDKIKTKVQRLQNRGLRNV